MASAYVNCNLCGSNNYEVLSYLGYPPLKLVRNVICRNCGLVYLNPIMGPDELRKYYYEYRKRTINLDSPTDMYEASARPLALYHYDFFREYCRPGMNILDIGCGAGTLMSWAVKDGLNAYGVNPDPGFGNYGPAHYGLKEVQISLFENSTYEYNMFDIITLNHVIEHFSDVTQVLGKIRNYLKDDGLVYISTPNILTPHGQLEYHLFLEHTYTFSPTSIRLLLQKMGFEIIKYSEYGYVTDKGLHHPFIDLVARKIDIKVPVTINWKLNRENYKDVLSYLSRYRNTFFKKNGRLKVYAGYTLAAVQNYLRNKRLLSMILTPLIYLTSRFAYSEPNYTTAPISTEFPKDKISYKQEQRV